MHFWFASPHQPSLRTSSHIQEITGQPQHFEHNRPKGRKADSSNLKLKNKRNWKW